MVVKIVISYIMSGWIKLHRKLNEWEWYDNSSMVHLFIHFLIKANISDKKWHGKDVLKGSFCTSFQKISTETGISIRTVRTCLERFEKSGEIKIESTNSFTCITVCNYAIYQNEKNISDTPPTSDGQTIDTPPTNGRQTGDKRSTTTKESKEVIEEEKEKEISTPKKFNFRSALLSFGFNSNLVDDWLVVRKNKKCTNTETAYKIFINQIEKHGGDKNLILQECVSKSWGGFESEWSKLPKHQTAQTSLESQEEEFNRRFRRS